MDKTKNNPSIGKHILAWLITLAGIPVITAAMVVWYIVLDWLLSFITPHITGLFLNNAWDEFIDTGLIAMIGGAILVSVGNIFINASVKVHPLQNGTRLILTALLSGACALYGLYSLLIDRVAPFNLSFILDGGAWFCTFCSMIVYAIQLIKDTIKFNKQKKLPPPPTIPICVFTHSSFEGGSRFTPFCYVSGGPGLVHKNGSMKIPRRDGHGLDLELYFAMRNFIYEIENVREIASHTSRYDDTPDPNWRTINAFGGVSIGDRAYCIDLIQSYPNNEKWNYADLMTSPITGNKAISFTLHDHVENIDGDIVDLGDLRKCRCYRILDDGTVRAHSTDEKVLAAKRALEAKLKEIMTGAKPQQNTAKLTNAAANTTKAAPQQKPTPKPATAPASKASQPIQQKPATKTATAPAVKTAQIQITESQRSALAKKIAATLKEVDSFTHDELIEFVRNQYGIYIRDAAERKNIKLESVFDYRHLDTETLRTLVKGVIEMEPERREEHIRFINRYSVADVLAAVKRLNIPLTDVPRVSELDTETLDNLRSDLRQNATPVPKKKTAK